MLNTICRLALCAWLLALSSCADRVQSRVEVFHQLTSLDASKSFVILPIEESKGQTLEFQTYKSKLAPRLESQGFRQFSGVGTPDLLVFLGYGIDNGQTQTVITAVPQYGQTGVSSSNTFGTINTFGTNSTFSGTTTYTPTYGVTGYIPVSRNVRTFGRFIYLSMFDIKNSSPENLKTVYEASISSEGSCGSLAEVFDEMLGAAFEDFPGTSGRARRVTIAGEFDC